MRTASGPHGIDLHAPGGVDLLLALHRGVFGDTRMEEPADEPSHPAGDDKQAGVTLDGETFHFPEATPLADMTDSQRVEYWRHKARKHESTVKARADYDDVKTKATKYDEYVASTATDVDKARAEARQQAEVEVSARFQTRLVEQAFRIAAAGRVDEKALSDHLGDVDLGRFLDADGEPDIGRITNSVARIAPSAGGGSWPPGSRAGGSGFTPAPTGRDQGLEEAKRRFGARQ